MHSLVLALLFCFIELLKLYRGSLWTGAGMAEFALGVPMGLAVYTLSVGIVAELVHAILSRMGKSPHTPVLVEALAPTLAALVPWVMFDLQREQVPTREDALVAVVLVGLFAGRLILPLLRLMTPQGFLAASGAALLSACFAVAALTEYFLLDPNRAELMTRCVLAWTLLAGIIGLCAWSFPGKRYSVWRSLFGLLVVVVAPLGLLVFLYVPPSVPSDNPAHPNIVLIVTDTMRADATGGTQCNRLLPDVWGGIAKQGVSFERHYSLAPWTLPSMVGLFASSYPPSANIDEVWNYQLREQDKPLAEILSAVGYETCALVGNPVVMGMPGMLRGFKSVYSSHHLVIEDGGVLRLFPFLRGAAVKLWPGLVVKQFNDSTRDLSRYARRFLQMRHDKPFFLWIHYMDPHAPYDPPSRYREMKGPWTTFWPYALEQHWGCPILAKGERVRMEDQPYVTSLFQGERTYVRDSVGHVLAQLKRKGVSKTTYTCITSDHGEELWEHGEWGHGHSLYEEQVKTPLIFLGPDVAARAVSQPVSSLHVTPTLAELAGVPADPSWKGASLLSALKDPSKPLPKQPCFARGTLSVPPQEPAEMVLVGNLKLIRSLVSGRTELYDLAVDPCERADLSESEAESIGEMTTLLDSWRAEHPATMKDYYGDSEVEDKQQRIQQLKAIGYL